MLYIKNAEIYTPHKIIKKGNILISGTKILKISERPFSNVSSRAEVIDAAGKKIYPGFIDVHLQGAGGYDFLDGTKEALTKICETLTKFGTTSLLATTVFKNGKNPHIENIVKFMKKTRGANILGIHLEGPFINQKKKGMIKPGGIRECNSSYLNKILKITKGRLKMITIAPELKGAIGIIKTLKKKKVVTSFGHSEATLAQTQKGIDAGITHATHIFNAMRPIHHRDPGPLGAILMDNRVSAQVISDGIHIHPDVLRMIVRLKGINNITLITDSMSSLGLGNGKYIYDGWRYESKDGACRYKDGTLIGTALPLNEMIKRMVKFGNINLQEAIQMATINPAKILKIDNKKGSVEKGKDADLIIADKTLNVLMTLIGGKVVYRKIQRG